MKQIIFATKNEHKLKEVSKLFGGFDIIGLDDNSPDVVEDKNSFYGNAMKKAVEISEHYGLPALADDSGLVIPALGGEPGIYSARYAKMNGSDLNAMDFLLERMKGMPMINRGAEYVCVIAFKDPDRDYKFHIERKCRGVIQETPVGDNGFAYDPVFYSLDLEKTFGEATLAEKNEVSHRGKAMREAMAVLRAYRNWIEKIY